MTQVDSSQNFGIKFLLLCKISSSHQDLWEISANIKKSNSSQIFFSLTLVQDMREIGEAREHEHGFRIVIHGEKNPLNCNISSGVVKTESFRGELGQVTLELITYVQCYFF